MTAKKRLTPTQVEEYKKKGISFKCDEAYTVGHKCQGKSLMLIECDEGEDNEEREEIIFEPRGEKKQKNSEISLHAMAGSTSPTTIRLLGQVNHKIVSILDTGSTHNFIDPGMALIIGLQVIPKASFNVTIAGDEQLQREGFCKAVYIKCQGVKIVANFHVLPIGGCQMVSGVRILDECH